MTAGFRGSSSGMPASILPTKSAPTSAAWLLEGLTGLVDNAWTFTPEAVGVGRVRCVVNGVTSNWAEVSVASGGPGRYVAWDKDSQGFYLCGDPGDPQTGLPITASGSYNVAGELVQRR